MKKILLSWMMGILVLFACTSTVQAEETVIMISTPEELDAVRENLSGHYQLANDIDMTGYYEIEPIGNETDGAFTGIFDGNGHTIKNLELNYDFYKYVGLFGVLEGTVQNVTLENAEIVGSRYVGGIAGYADVDSLITGCEVSGSVEGGSAYFTSYVAGIVGRTMGTVKDCTNGATVWSSLETTDVAGITVGVAELIENCHNTGYIRGCMWVDGIAGSAKIMRDCSNRGYLSANNGGTVYVCGVGSATTLENCSNSGTINATSSSGSATVYGVGSAATLENCSNSGNITATSSSSSVTVYAVGNSNLESCCNSGNISATSSKRSTTVYGIGYSGIKNCSNTGAVSSSASSADSYAYGIGYSGIKNCSNTGAISSSSASYSPYAYGIGHSGIENCSNTGAISSSASYLDSYAYGIGYSGIKNCSNTGAISSYSAIYSSSAYGIGYSEIENCSNTGAVYSADSYAYGIGYSKIKNSADFSQKTIKNYVYSGTNIIQYTYKNDGRMYIGSRSYTFDPSRGREAFEEIVNSEALAQLDYETTYVRDEEWNSGLPMLQAIPTHLELNEIYLFLYSGESARLKGRVGDVEVSDITYTSSNEEAVTVSSDGLVTAQGGENAFGVVTARTADGYQMNCHVFVYNRKPESVAITNKPSALYAGQIIQLNSHIEYEMATERTLTWTSSNSNVATVSADGILEAKGAGAATITVSTVNNKTDSFSVTVSNPSFTLDSTTATVNVDKTKKLGITLTPENLEQHITWTSADETIATVDSDGNVTGVSQGTVTITATSEYGITASCEVTVTKLANEITLDRTSITMEKGSTDNIGITLNPIDATDTITYTSSNTNVVTVSGTGLLTAKAVGTSQITVTTSGGLKAYCSVVVTNASIPATDLTLSETEVEIMPEETIILNATLTPTNATTNKITWSSSDDSVATVNQGGMVTAVSNGKATIRAELSNGIYRICEVTVKAYSSTVVTVKNASADQGEIVSVPFEIKENAGIASMRLKITYDSTILTPVGVTADDILSGAQIAGNVDEEGSYYVLWSQAENMTENGTMFNVDFQVADGAETGIITEIGVSYTEGDVCDEAHNDIELTSISGEVSILSMLLGDVYVDQMLNSHDILLLQQYMTELVTLDARQMKRADMNSDGNVTMQDIVLLAQTLVNPSAFSQPAAMAVLNLLSETYEPFAINLGSVELNDKGYAEVPVSFENCPGISAFKFKINYNAEEIELEEVSAAGEVFSGNLMSNLENASSGEAVVTWYSNKNVVPNGAVMTLRFVAKTDELTSASVITMTTTEGDLCDEACNSVSVAINDGAVLPKEPEVKTPVTEIFTDLKAGSWYIDEIQYVYDKSIMTGVSDTTFEPETAVTRATIVQTLYKLEGKPAVNDFTKYNSLNDTLDNIWWKNGLAWALNTGVAKGDSQNHVFNPDNEVTREDLATFIYRYAQIKGINVELKGNVDEILGDTFVNSWAKTSFAWAIETGLIKGKTIDGVSDLAPQVGATRAELATIMMRFYENNDL